MDLTHRAGAACRAARSAGLAAAAVSCAGWTAGPPDHERASGLTIQANSFTSSDQANAAIGIAPDGTAVVAWESRRQDAGTSGVFARAVSAEGLGLSPELRVNTWTPGQQHRPAVGVTADGAAWIVWASIGQDGDGGAVVARRFDPALSGATGEIVVNASGASNQHSPAIAVDDDGGALIAWNHEDPRDVPGWSRVIVRLLGRDAAPLADEARVDAGGERCGAPCIARDPCAGGFIVAWGCADADGRPMGLAWSRVDGRGVPAGHQRWLDGCGGIEPSLAVDHEGRLVAAWMVGGDDGYSVRARWFDGEGAPLGQAVTLADAAEGTASGAAVAIDADRREALVAYNRADGPDGRSTIFVSRFTPDGAVGSARRLLGVSRGEQRLACAGGGARLAWAGDDRVAVAWGGDAGLEDRSAAHVTFAGADLGEPVSEAMDAFGSDEPGVSVAGAAPGPEDLPPVWDDNFKPQGPLGEQSPGSGEFGFEAVPGTSWAPPDPGMAVGPDHVVAVVNGQIAFFGKNGACTFRQPLGSEGNPGFWEPVGAGNFVFDPEALYDPWTGRFWVMACERTLGSFFNIAVSDDGDPNGVWHKYRIHMTTPGSGDIDSPNIAVDEHAVYLTADFFSGGDKYLVYMLPKAPLVAGEPAPAGTTQLITGWQSHGLARSHGETAPAQYLVQAMEQQSNSTITLHAISEPLTAPTRVTFTLPVPVYQFPGSPPQLGTSLSMTLFEPRFWSCVYHAGSVWAAHHIRTPTSGGRAVVRWYEFALNGWPASGQDPAVRQWGEIDAGPGLHAYFASIGVDAEGNAVITFARSGVSEFIGMWRAARRWNDPPGTFRPMQLVRASTSPYTSYGRWGDYCATEPDPIAGCTFWGHHEFTTSTNVWRTWVGRYRVLARCDINEDCALSVQDFGAFQAIFGLEDPRADFDGNGQLTVADFGAFQTAFALGQ